MSQTAHNLYSQLTLGCQSSANHTAISRRRGSNTYSSRHTGNGYCHCSDRTGCTRGMLRFAASVVDLCDTRNEPLRVLLFGSCWRLFSKSQYQFLGMDQTTAWHVVLPPTKPGVLHSLHRSWEDAHLINYHLAGPDLRYFSRCSILLSSVARSAHVHAQQAVLRTTLAACLLGNTSISTKL
jgi:hypothetical protein